MQLVVSKTLLELQRQTQLCGDIMLSNKGAILEMLKVFKTDLEELELAIKKEDLNFYIIYF